MASSKVDIIVLGATGFTGKYVVRECARKNNSSWSVAGRDEVKLRELLELVSLDTGIDVTKKEIIIADCSRPESLVQMADRGRVVINCTGPYRFHGENVVKACVDRGTHYVDVTGEPEFMEKMQLLYHDLAKQKGSYVVNACGLDSVPTDIGIVHFSRNFPGQVNYVETYLQKSTHSDKYEPFLNFTTWESAVHGFANIKSLIEIRKKLFAKSKMVKPEPSIPRRPTVHPCPVFDNKPSIPFPGADKSVVVRSQMLLANDFGSRPIQCSVYLVCNTKLVLWGLLLMGYFLQTLTQYAFGRKLLLQFPGLFTFNMINKDGPAEETLRNSSMIFKFYGEGWSEDTMRKNNVVAKTINEPTDSYMITSVEVHEPSYGFTSMCVVQCALLLLNESDKLPANGGVYTPAGAFHRTNIVEILAENGVHFKIEKRGQK